MTYQMQIRDQESKDAYFRFGTQLIPIKLVVGAEYEVYIDNPKNKKDQKNNRRKVILLGFEDEFCGDPLVRYTDTNRRGRVRINSLKPIELCLE